MWIECRCNLLNQFCHFCHGTGIISAYAYIDIGIRYAIEQRILLPPKPIQSYPTTSISLVKKDYFEITDQVGHDIRKGLQVGIFDYRPSLLNLEEALMLNYKKEKKWRLPTLNELKFIRKYLVVKGIRGNFKLACYLSSTQINSNDVILFNFSNGEELISAKHPGDGYIDSCYVRLVRDYNPDVKLIHQSKDDAYWFTDSRLGKLFKKL